MGSRSIQDHEDRDPALEALAAAWRAAPPAPDLAALLTSEVNADPERLAPLVRFDALERHRRGLSWSAEHYLSTLPDEAAPAGSPVVKLLIGLELGLKKTSPEALKARLDPSHHELIDRLAAERDAIESELTESVATHEASTASMPPTGAQDARGHAQADTAGEDAAAKDRGRASSSAAGSWSKGDRIGPYTLRKRLGAGGFGEVWLASRRSPDLDVAIKVLKPGATDEDSVRRFEVEAQALAFLEHRYICKIHDAGTAQRQPYIAMEFIEGKPLTRYCDDRRLSLEQRLELMVRICEGVQHAHQRGLIHRDLSPDNILVTEIVKHPKEVDQHERRLVVDRTDGEATIAVPKIVDFGLAKAAEKTVRLPDGTLTVDLGKIMGKPEYMAPEQAGHQPQEVTQKADIFALGVILYELLAGTLPLTKDELRKRAIDELVAMLRGTLRPEPSTRFSRLDEETAGRASYQRGEINARELVRTLRGRVRHLCGTALRLEPEKRFTSVAALGLDIRNYLEDRDYIEAAAEPRLDRILRNIRRHRLPYAAAAAVFLALVGGVAGTTWQAKIAVANEQRANEQAEIAREAEAAEKRAKEDEAEQRRLATEAAKQARDERDKAQEALRTIERNAYTANIQMASQWLDGRRFDRARERLDACPQHLRHWEWHWLNARSDTSLVELRGHTGGVESASFSPDGTRIVTASQDNTARVWDAATGEALAELVGHTSWVYSPSFSPDGTRIVTASQDNTARVWDAATGEALAELVGHTNWVRSASFSPDGTRIVTASFKIARVWDAATGETLAELAGHTGGVESASFSPDGTQIVTASQDNTARVWDAATGEALAELVGHTSWVYSPSFSPDGTRIVTASQDNTARVWDAGTGETLAELVGHTSWVYSPSFSPDGTRIVTASQDNTARVWDAATGEALAELKGHMARVFSASFSPDGTRIVTAFDNTARVWDAATGEALAELVGHTNWVRSASFSPDGTRIVTASFKIARVWDAATGETLAELAGHTGGVESASFSPDGTRIVTASRDKTARVWDAGTGETLAELEGHTFPVTSASFTPDGTRIVTAASYANTMRVWDAVPYRVRHAERRANQRGEDGSAVVRAWMEKVGFPAEPSGATATGGGREAKDRAP